MIEELVKRKGERKENIKRGKLKVRERVALLQDAFKPSIGSKFEH